MLWQARRGLISGRGAFDAAAGGGPGGGGVGANSDLKYWFNGLPYNGHRSGITEGDLKYWFNGLPDNMGLK